MTFRQKLIIGSLVATVALGGVVLLGWQHRADLFLRFEPSPPPTPPTLLKVGFSTDWEYGSRKRLEHKLPIQGLPELKKVVAYYNDVFRPDLVIGGGDYIESSATKPEKAKAQLREIHEVFKTLTMPRYYALGNHDMRSLTKREVMDILGIEESHVILDQGDWRLVIFDSNFHHQTDADRGAENYTDGYVNQAEMAWLDAALDTDRPTIVFSHHSPAIVLSQSDGENNRRTVIKNGAEVRALLERHPNVVASMSGHTPRPQYTEINGIHYFIADTLVNEAALGAFATIELTWHPDERRGEILFEHYGLRRETYHASKVLQK